MEKETNRVIHTLPLGGKLEKIKLEGNGMSFVVNGTKIKVETYHDQDCCESVEGDFSVVPYYKEQLKDEYTNLTIKAVDAMGFLLCFEEKYGVGTKVFIPCYNNQNGYYSDELDLIISNGDTKTTIGISDLAEDHID